MFNFKFKKSRYPYLFIYKQTKTGERQIHDWGKVCIALSLSHTLPLSVSLTLSLSQTPLSRFVMVIELKICKKVLICMWKQFFLQSSIVEKCQVLHANVWKRRNFPFFSVLFEQKKWFTSLFIIRHDTYIRW